MINYKNLILISFLASFVFSSQMGNYYNGAIPSYTKTPKKGKINFENQIAFTMVNKLFDSNGDLVSLSDEQKTSLIAYQGRFRYHGMHAAGIDIILNGMIYDTETDGLIENSNTSTLGVYWSWDEMFTYKTPAFIPWQDGYTFPSTRNLTGLYFSENYTYLKHSMDFIFGPKMILSGFLDLTNDKVYSDSVNKLGLRLIYDIDNDFSVAGGLVYSDSAVSVHASGGYQFKDVSAGNLKMNFKLVPSISLMVSGENSPVFHLVNLGLYTYFN